MMDRPSAGVIPALPNAARSSGREMCPWPRPRWISSSTPVLVGPVLVGPVLVGPVLASPGPRSRDLAVTLLGIEAPPSVGAYVAQASAAAPRRVRLAAAVRRGC